MFKSTQHLSSSPIRQTLQGIFLVFILLFTNSCTIDSHNPPKKDLQLDFLTVISSQERSGLEYLLNKQSNSDYSIFTNYKETGGQDNISTGHEQLSESIGLMMEYALNRKSQVLFDTQFQLLKERFLTKENLAKWRVHASTNRTSESSALVDDLRIVKALYGAGDLWGKEDYTQLGTQMSDSILLYETQDTQFIELYDGFAKTSPESIPLFYLDLAAISSANVKDARWQPLLENSRKILTEGVISQQLPLYHHSYNYSTQVYTSGDSINMIEALLPLLSLYEMGDTNKPALLWLNQQISTHQAIYTSYSTKDGKPASSSQSAAVYALTARIAHLAGDDALSTKCLTLLSKRQIKPSKSPLSGAFGDEPSQMVYSYDNLQALLAYSQP